MIHVPSETSGATVTDRTQAASPRHQPGGLRTPLWALLPLVMAALVTTTLPAAGSSVAPTGAGVVPAQGDADGGQVYQANCASCHQADGSGVPGTFPPLRGNADVTDPAFVEQVVREGLSGPIEVDGVTYDGQMPAFGQLSDAEVAAVVDHVVALGGAGAAAAAPSTTAPPEPGDPAAGRDLFVGSARFANGAAACASCHTAGDVGNLGGWSLGPDLTDVFPRLGGEVGLSSWLSAPASPTMRPIFGDHPLTEAEIADLVAFLGDAPDRTPPSTPVDGLLLAGAAGLVVLIAAMAFFWRGMRRTYVQKLTSPRRPRSA